MLALLRDGLSNEEIGVRLGVSPSTAKFHVSEILGKLGVPTREEAARWMRDGSTGKRFALLAPLRRLHVGWPLQLAGAAVVLAAVAGIGTLVWGVTASRNNGAAPAQGVAASVPPAQPATVTALVAVSSGDAHSCALTAGGGVVCWGRDDAAQLGSGPGPDSPVPLYAGGLNSGMMAIAAGSDFTCALGESGGVKCWGDDSWGQLGDGAVRAYSARPVDVRGIDGTAIMITAGERHACALSSDGNVYCWGGNDLGQIGDGTTATRPGAVKIALRMAATAVGAGGEHTCAVLATSGLQCWGRDWEGQAGDGTTAFYTKHLEPVDVVEANNQTLLGVRSVSTGGGFGHTCALMSSAAVRCWGSRAWGELGDGVTPEGAWRSSVPTDVLGIESAVIGLSAGGTEDQGGHTCVVTAEHEVKCWGRGYEGQLGITLSDADGVIGTATSVPGLRADSVSAGARHTCAVSSGEILCWGQNDHGQLGDGGFTSRAAPAPVVFDAGR